MTPAVRLVTGWAHPSGAMAPLAESLILRGLPDVAVVAADSLDTLPPGGVLAGWSLGGLQVLNHLVHHPGQADLGVLISAGPRFCADPATGYPGQPMAMVRGMLRSLKRDARSVLTRFHQLAAQPDTPDPTTLDARVAASLDLGIPTLARGLEDLLCLDLRESLHHLTCPLLALHGDRDPIQPVAVLDTWAANDRVTTARHPDAGHPLVHTHPEWIADRILDALTRIPRD